MRRNLLYKMAISLLGLVLFHACRKISLCEECEARNKVPVAEAGSDQWIVLPVDSASLDGSKSGDPDGKIVQVLWKRLSGPTALEIGDAAALSTKVYKLVEGDYLFELQVTDDGGLSDLDSVWVRVNGHSQTNRAPKASAGPDHYLVLPANRAMLDGSASVDPDDNITRYHWTKVAGPPLYTLKEDSNPIVWAENLVEGIYLFQLEVQDAGSLIGRDTVQVNVRVACNAGSRPLINVQLIPVGSLSQVRANTAVASAGNKIFIAGGFVDALTYSRRVDIFDIPTQSWSQAELSTGRSAITAVSLGDKVFFAGGYHGGNLAGNSDRVDIYDVSAARWTTAALSKGRSMMAGAAAGDKVVFAGGMGWGEGYHKDVDIYDTTKKSWTKTMLSDRPRDAGVGIAATVLGTKMYFAGSSSNWPGYDMGDLTSTINVYDAATGTWSLSSLSNASGFLAGIAFDNKIMWAGGDAYPNTAAPYTYTDHVEIRDMTTGTSSFACLFQPNAYHAAVRKDNKIILFTGDGTSTNRFDIYDIGTNTWSVGVLPVRIQYASVIAVDNTIYVAGGYVNGALSSKVWKLQF